MNDFSFAVGQKIALKRDISGWTQKQLAQNVQSWDSKPVTARTVGRWERGEQEMTAEDLASVALAFHCSADSLLVQTDIPTSERIATLFCALPLAEQQILRYIVYDWQGDYHALVRFCGLYVSMNPKDRAQLAGYGLWWYAKCRDKFAVNNFAPPVDYEFIRNCWRKITDAETLI